MQLKRWANLFLIPGAIMVAIGVLPLLVFGQILGMSVPWAGFLFLSVTPLGAILLALGLLLWLVVLIRR